jgi:predicted nucleic acid-binding protein
MLSGAVPVNPDTDDYLDATIGLRKYSDHPITLVDALLARMTRRLDAPVWSFDRHFITMRSSVWKSDIA